MTHPNIQAEELYIGKNVVISPTASIRGVAGKAKRISLGDQVYIGDHVQIICDDFAIGDYAKIHHHTNIHGYLPCHIGHNAWVGQYTIIDSIGGVEIGNNCGIGAHSQLWSHIKYGDTLEGCRFLSEGKLTIGHDVWFVGHCIVSPIVAENKAMALAGSVVTQNMKANEIYAGSPAISISHKIGHQFQSVGIAEKYEKMLAYLTDFGRSSSIQIVKHPEAVNFDDEISYFDVSTRQYTKTQSASEVAFMKFLLPEKAKFVPFNG